MIYYEYKIQKSNGMMTHSKLLKKVSQSDTNQLVLCYSALFVMVCIIWVQFSSFYNPDLLKELPHMAYNEQFRTVILGRWPVWLRATYNAFAIPLFMICLVLFLCPLFVGERLVVLKDTLGSNLFRAMAKVTYTVYLLHFFTLMYYFFSATRIFYQSHMQAIFLYFSASCLIYFGGLIQTILVEIPVRNLWKLYLSPMRKKKKLGRKLN